MSVETPGVSAADTRRRQQTNWQIWSERLTTLAPVWTLLLLILVFGVASNWSFLRLVNLNNILVQSSTLAILATGMTFVLLTGEIDLSIAAVMGLTGMIAAYLYKNMGLTEPLPVILALGVATLLGFISGFVSMRFRIPTFMTTLAMSMIADGLNQWLSKGATIFERDFSGLLKFLGSGRVGGEDSLLRVLTVIAVVVLLIGFLILRYTRFGRYVYMTGASKSAARLAGVNTSVIIIACLTISSFLAGLAGIINAGRLGSAMPLAIPSYLIETIAAVVLGGTSLTGGRGSMLFTAVGVLTYQTLRNGLDNITSIDNFMKVFITGLVLLIALVINVVFSGRAERDKTT
ncbi:MAG: ABC transporter permease [Anaerolineae bacterium]|nr:ABC transporter permease [Anaerolineae bacterium]